jgi:pyridoxamine 5'-phosphate oxidase
MSAPDDLIPPSPTAADYAKSARDDGGPAFIEAEDPFALFAAWLKDARAREINDANGVALATVEEAGMPDVRMVLLKDFDARGFVFYTNFESAKGRQIKANPKAALLFHWKSLRRQVRVRGLAHEVTPAEADAYFAARDRGARIGAWASDQSRPMQDRFDLEKRVASYAAKFGLGDVPRPPHWSGWRIEPLAFEFWRDRPFRLHERLTFTRAAAGDPWEQQRLYP